MCIVEQNEKQMWESRDVAYKGTVLGGSERNPSSSGLLDVEMYIPSGGVCCT